MQFAETDTEIAACLPPLRALRPHLEAMSEADFIARVRRQQAQGYRLAYRAADGMVHSAAGFRILEFLAWGTVLYIDDLVTRAESRGKGHAGALLDAVIAHARAAGCDAVHLDSGYQRHTAHRLYLNHGFQLNCHHFACRLDDGGNA